MQMLSRTASDAGLLLVVCFTALGLRSSLAADRTPLVQRWPAEARVYFNGTSTLHDFGGNLSAEPFDIVVSNRTWFASVDVLSGQMATANEKRDRNMYQMLGTNQYPHIHGDVANAPLLANGASATNVALQLKIRDQATALPANIRDWRLTDSELRFRAAWSLSLKQYGLKPPSVAGIIRVGDRVELQAEVVARIKPQESGAPPKSP